MKKKLTILLSAAMTASMLAACGTQDKAEATETKEKKPSVNEVSLESGNVTVYDYCDMPS